MQAVLQLFFDNATDTLFRSLWHKLKDAGLPNPMLDKPATPHVTLSFGNDVNADGLVGALSRALRDTSSVDLTFASLATFANKNGVVFVAPVVTAELLELHSRVQGSMLQHASSTNGYSETNRWFPHATLTMRLTPAEIVEAFRVLGGLRLPVFARGTRVSLLEFPSLRELASWHLLEKATGKDNGTNSPK